MTIPEQPEMVFCLIHMGNTLVTIYHDGSIEFGPTYEPTLAAREFWDVIRATANGLTTIEPVPPKVIV